MPTWVNHWRYQWDQDVRLARPAKTVYVRFTGKPAVNVLRATVHLKPDKRANKAVQITHAYRVGDRLTERLVELDGPAEYTVHVDGQPRNVFIRMAVPSHVSANQPDET